MNSLKRFLLVEDSLEVANEVKWLFNDTGYLTGGVNNLSGDLGLIQKFYLIILDITMPDGDGEELFRLIKSSPAIAGFPTLFSSFICTR
jgi:DNA-binding response OmpR family regulator